MRGYYKLLPDGSVEETTLLEWGWEFEKKDRHLGFENLVDSEGNIVQVSTVFLGIDHGFAGPPVLFETMIFGGKHNDYMERYRTYSEALEGHQRAIQMVIQPEIQL